MAGAPALAVVGVLVALSSLWLSSCQATVRIGVNVGAGGAGTVVVTALLDPDAARAVPDLAQQLRTADLQQAGWHIDGPKPAAGGGTTVVATKAFRTPAEANQILGELSGASGPFRLRVGQHRSFLSTSTTFSGTVDLTCGLQCFGDSQLQQQLGANLGLDPAKLQQAGINPGQILGFEVGVHLPGSIRSTNAPARVHGDPQWPLKLGDRSAILATSRALDRTRVAVLGAAAAAVLVVGVALVVRWRRRRSARRLGPSRRHRRWRARHRAFRR